MTNRLLLGLFGLVAAALAQDHRIVVTAEGHKDSAPPEIARSEVMASIENQRALVTGWTSTRDTGTELWVLIDDGTDANVSLQFDELRKFMLDQPSGTKIGVGYLRNGSVMATQALTADHALAAKALRLPLSTAGISSSPYMAITELIHKWPATDQAREVLLISSGIDSFFGAGPDNPYLTRAIDTAQRASVVVYSIYYGTTGHFGHSFWQINWGQNYLSQISDETGGEFFWQGNQNPVSFAPYLRQLNEHLNAQHVLTFQPPPSNTPGYKRVKVTTEIPRAGLVTQSRVYNTNK